MSRARLSDVPGRSREQGPGPLGEEARAFSAGLSQSVHTCAGREAGLVTAWAETKALEMAVSDLVKLCLLLQREACAEGHL